MTVAFADLVKTNPIPTNVCPVCWITDKPGRLSDEDREDLEAALGYTGARFTAISREFAALGYKVTPDAVGRHVQGQCPAGKHYR